MNEWTPSIEINPIGGIPEAIQAVAEAIKAGVELMNSFRERRNAAKESNWALLQDTAATAQALVTEHLKAVNTISAPARRRQDIASTAALLRTFVDDGSLPQSYEELHGVLGQLIRTGVFRRETSDALHRLEHALGDFQREAFMQVYSSWGIADAVEVASELEQQLAVSPPPLARIDQLQRSLTVKNAGSNSLWDSFHRLPGTTDVLDDYPEPTSPEAIKSLLGAWFKAWFEHVQKTLIGRQGLNRIVGELKAMK